MLNVSFLRSDETSVKVILYMTFSGLPLSPKDKYDPDVSKIWSGWARNDERQISQNSKVTPYPDDISGLLVGVTESKGLNT